MFFRNDFTFGGNNGLTDFKFVLNYDINSAATQRAFYMLSGLLLLGSYVFSRWLTTTKFGKVQRAIRDSENRVLFSGYATANFKLFVFVYAAVISGMAGCALYAASGNHQPERDVSGKVARGGRLGGGRRPRHAGWADHRFRRRQCAQELGNTSVSRPLADHPWRSLRLDRSLHAQGNRRHPWTNSGTAEAPEKAGVSRRCACRRSSKLKRRMKPDFILTAEGVNKSFDGFKAIHDLNFYLDKGELRTIIGPNGAGKSTFLDLITGRTRPDSGSIEYRGTPVTKLREYEIYRLGIGRKFQTPSVYSDHTVFENILLGLEGSRGVWSSIFGRVSSAQRERIFEVLEIIGLKDRAETKAGNLAHGQKQWLEIGMLLAQNAQLLLVDEPAAGMTDEETAKTGDLLLSFAGQHTIIVIEHDMVFVRQLGSKVTVLHQGHVLCDGTLDEVQNDERVIEVYLGRKKKH